MKWAIVVLGLILLAGGVAGLAHPVITYHQKEEVAKLGPIQATVDKEKSIEVPMPVSVAAIAAGLALVVVGARRKS